MSENEDRKSLPQQTVPEERPLTGSEIGRRSVLGGALALGAAVGLGGMPIARAAEAQRADPATPDRKVVPITGTSSGFGYLMAPTLARAGHRVFASMRNSRTANAGPASQLRDLARAEELELDVIDIDVRDDHSVEAGVRQVLQRADRIDVLVNNAAVYYPALIETLTISDIRDVFETNLFGPLRMNRAVLPSMRNQRDGLIVQMSTGLGRLVLPFTATYSGGKFALEAMTEITRYEVSTFGIDVVIVEPTRYNTDLIIPNGVSYYQQYLQRLSPEDARRRQEYGPLAERLAPILEELPTSADPQEVADAVAHLVRVPNGKRPVRLIPAGNEQVVELNGLTERLMQKRMESAGYGDLL